MYSINKLDSIQIGKYTIVLLVLLLPSCLSLPFWIQENNSISSIQISSSSNQNSSQPVAIDAVFIYDEALALMVAGFTATNWFMLKQEIVASFPSRLAILHWEISPDTRAVEQQLPVGSEDALYVVVFADYNSRGTHRIDITDMTEVGLQLGSRSVAIQTEN